MKLDTMVSNLSFFSSDGRWVHIPNYWTPGSVLPVNPDAHKFAKDFYRFLSNTRPSGKAKLEPNPVRLMPGGLARVVPDGFVLLGSGSVSQRTRLERSEDYMRPISGEKLVYKIG